MHSHSIDGGGLPSNNIWTHGESLRFVTINTTTTTIWEVGFTSGDAPTEVETFPVPDDFNYSPYQGPQIWDVKNSESLLRFPIGQHTPSISFSSDGHFFAHSTYMSEIHLLTVSPTGYILHQILPSSNALSHPLLSPNGRSIAMFYRNTIRLLPTKILLTPPSGIRPHGFQSTDRLILYFSPDGVLAAAVRTGGVSITVLNLESGVPLLTIDAGRAVYGLRVTKSTITALCFPEVITWNLPGGDRAYMVKLLYFDPGILAGAISFDSRLAGFVKSGFTDIYSASTGEHIGRVHHGGSNVYFSLDGSSLWGGPDSGRASVRPVRGDGEVPGYPTGMIDVEGQPEECPWRPSRGYLVTSDWWLLDRDGKRLLMFPPSWRSDVVHRAWKGRFLALLHAELSEPVILNLDVSRA